MSRIPWRALPLLAAAALCLYSAGKPQTLNKLQTLNIDKTRFEAYVRYAEGYTSGVKLTVEDPTPSAYKGFLRVVVHASLGSQQFVRVYYATPDGEHFINGSIWDLNQSPQLDTLEHLPTSGPSFGSDSPQVTIVIFSDFECPYCRQLAHTIRENIPKKYPNEVRVIFEDFPLDSIHPWARSMAEAGHCIGDGNAPAFWNFHDWVFEHQQDIKPENLRDKVLTYTREHGLDLAKVTNCLDSHAAAAEVRSYQQSAELLQVQQTPTLFLNGRILSGAVPWETIDGVIKLELNRPKDIVSAVPSSCCEVAVPPAARK